MVQNTNAEINVPVITSAVFFFSFHIVSCKQKWGRQLD
jgi:hypothetical protein